MEYLQASFTFKTIEEYQKDIFIDDLAQIGFDSFEDTFEGMNAFVIKEQFNSVEFDSLVKIQDFDFSYELIEVEPQNWNKAWESNFKPLVINDKCYVRATFHQTQPQYEYEIVIDPKMAFGTGHHQTTTLMMQYILEEEFDEESILDMGAGTAILGILVAKKGAKTITAIDYDEICYESALENAKLNAIDNLTSIHGGKEVIPDEKFEVIFANINRNILLDQMDRYAEVLTDGGRIFFSGFYEVPDLSIIQEAAERHRLKYVNHKVLGGWTAAKFVK